MTKKKYVPTDEEKKQIKAKYDDRCYICEEPLEGYDDSEVQYDHIYASGLGIEGGEEIDKFAPIHASADPSKKNCHGRKGQKSWYEYKEELRIEKELHGITGLRDVCKTAKRSTFRIISDKEVEINSRCLPLYDQKLYGKSHKYFYDEIPIDYIENDELIQLRPLEEKIKPLTFHLRKAVQLLPSVGRLNTSEGKIKIFDGQHKAIAQIVGNKRGSIPCIIFVDPDVADLQVIVHEAHSKFLQQRYKRSHIIDKLADQYRAKIERWKMIHGDIPYSEKDIIGDEAKRNRRKFILSGILAELSSCGLFIGGILNFENDLVDTTKKKAGRRSPMLWDNYERFVSMLVNLETVGETANSLNNYREDEVENLKFLLSLLYWFAIKDKWNPDQPDSESHQLAVRFFYDKVFEVWGPMLVKALRYSYEQKVDRALGEHEALCYRDVFPEDIKKRLEKIFQRLFYHGMWSNFNYKEIFRSTTSGPIADLFAREGLDHIYLTKVG